MVMMEYVRGSHTYGRFKELYKAHCIYRVRSHVPSYCNVCCIRWLLIDIVNKPTLRHAFDRRLAAFWPVTHCDNSRVSQFIARMSHEYNSVCHDIKLDQ